MYATVNKILGISLKLSASGDINSIDSIPLDQFLNLDNNFH